MRIICIANQTFAALAHAGNSCVSVVLVMWLMHSADCRVIADDQIRSIDSGSSKSAPKHVPIAALSFDSAGSRILAASGPIGGYSGVPDPDGFQSAVQLIDVGSMRVIRTLSCCLDGYTAAVFGCRGQHIAVADYRGTLRIWSGDGCHLLRQSTIGDNEPIWYLEMSYDESLLAICSGDRLRVLRTRDLREVGVCDRPEGIASIAFVPESHHLVIGGRTVKIVDAESPTLDLVRYLRGPQALPHVNNGSDVAEAATPGDSSFSVAVSSDGGLVAACGSHTAEFYDVRSGSVRVVRCLECGLFSFSSIRFAPGTSFAMFAGEPFKLGYWRWPLDSSKIVRSMDGTIMTWNDEEPVGEFVVWDIEHGAVTARVKDTQPPASVFAVSARMGVIARPSRDSSICTMRIPKNERGVGQWAK